MMSCESINVMLATVVAMAALLSGAMLASVSGLRWIAAKAEARALYLENHRAESRRWREIAEARCEARLREYEGAGSWTQAAQSGRADNTGAQYEARPADQVEIQPRGLAGE